MFFLSQICPKKNPKNNSARSADFFFGYFFGQIFGREAAEHFGFFFGQKNEENRARRARFLRNNYFLDFFLDKKTKSENWIIFWTLSKTLKKNTEQCRSKQRFSVALRFPWNLYPDSVLGGNQNIWMSGASFWNSRSVFS